MRHPALLRPPSRPVALEPARLEIAWQQAVRLREQLEVLGMDREAALLMDVRQELSRRMREAGG